MTLSYDICVMHRSDAAPPPYTLEPTYCSTGHNTTQRNTTQRGSTWMEWIDWWYLTSRSSQSSRFSRYHHHIIHCSGWSFALAIHFFFLFLVSQWTSLHQSAVPSFTHCVLPSSSSRHAVGEKGEWRGGMVPLPTVYCVVCFLFFIS